MAEFIPTKLTSSKLLGILYTYAKQLELFNQELARSKDDQNIATCRQEYIESIWGVKVNQVFTSDFTLAEYRALLLALVKITLQDSTNQTIIDTVHAYFPEVGVEILQYWKSPEDMTGYDWQNTSFRFMGAGGLTSTEAVVRGDTSEDALKGRVYSITRVGLTESSSDYTEGIDFEVPIYPSDYYIRWLGSGGDEPEEGQTYYVTYTAYSFPDNAWNANRPWVPDITELGFFLFGVQILLTGVGINDVAKVEQYVIPALDVLVKPAGIYYKVIVTDIELAVAYKEKSASIKENLSVDTILGFGLPPFGSPAPAGSNDFGFGSPSLPEYIT